MDNENSNLKLKLPSLGLGGWVFGGNLWGGTNEEDSIKTIQAALDYNINFIDTAPIYGFGRSENVIGKATRKKRSQYIIASKCGLIKEGKAINHNLSYQSIINECDASLSRLKTDYIDLYQCHWPDLNIPIEESLEALTQLKNQGKILAIGVSNFENGLLKKSCSLTEIVTAQYPYSILNREIEKEIIPITKGCNLDLITYGSLGGGILSGKYKAEPNFRKADVRKFFYQYYRGDVFKKISLFLDALSEIDKPLNQIAINWIRQKNDIKTLLVGCRTLDQLRNNAAALSWDLIADEILYIDNKMDDII